MTERLAKFLSGLPEEAQDRFTRECRHDYPTYPHEEGEHELKCGRCGETTRVRVTFKREMK